MPPRQKQNPASALVVGESQRGGTRSPPLPALTGGPSPDNANRVSNPDAAINTIGRGIADAGRSLQTNEENQRIIRERRERDRLQGAAEARTDREAGVINHWQFANSENYRNETASLFSAHYSARLSVVEAEVDRSSNPDYLKGQAAYLKILKADYDKQAQGIFAEDVEKDSVVQAGRASFTRTTTAVQDRLKFLGDAHLGQLLDEIDLDDSLNAEQRHELTAEAIEQITNSYYLDETARKARLTDLNSANDATLRGAQADRRAEGIEREKIVVKDQMQDNKRDIEVISRGIFVRGADGEISTDGNQLVRFLVKINERAEAIQPATDERGRRIEDPYYTESAINRFAAEHITEGLVSYVRANGAGKLTEKLISQQYDWSETKINSDGTTEKVVFHLKPGIIDKINKADKAFLSSELKKIGTSSKRIIAEFNKPFIFRTDNFKEGQAKLEFLRSIGELDSPKGVAYTIRQTHSYEVALQEANIQSKADAVEFAENIRDGSVIDYIDSDNEEIAREYLANEILIGIDNASFEHITGRPYPYSAEGFHKPSELRDALNYRNPQNADLETGIRHTEIITAEAMAGAELAASGLGMTGKRLKALASIIRKADGDEAILENVEGLLQQTIELAVSEFGASEENLARGLAESLEIVREDNNNLTRIFFQGKLNGSSGGLATQFYAYKEGILEIRENETEDIILARAEVRDLLFDNFSVESLKGGDALWNVDSRASEFLKESLMQGIHNGELEEGRDYTITEEGRISLNYSAENMRSYFTNFFNGIKPLEQAPYQLRNSVGVIDAIPKMPLPQGVKDPGGRLRANAILNFAFASPTMQNSVVYQAFVSQLGEGAQEEIDKFRIAIRTRRNDSPAENMRIIPSEAGIEITYPTIEGVVRFPYILPWELFDEFFYAETANK